MFNLFASNLTSPSLSADVLLCGAVLLCVSALVGFVAGVFYERAAAKRALSRAQRNLTQLVNVVVKSLESARQACSALESMPHAVLSTNQLQQLETKQTSLLETVSRVVSSQQSLAETVAEKTIPQSEPVEFSITWQRGETTDAAGLPDREVFDANLELLLAAGDASQTPSGLLFIKIDKYDQLQSRYGAAKATALLRKLSTVVCRAGRDKDLLCRFSTDTLAMLLPQVDAATGRLLSQKIRDSVRSFQFRLDESGPEVYVTASFGLTLCEPADNRDLVLNRAGNAVSRSQRRGRNQLHLHDGETTVHCLAG